MKLLADWTIDHHGRERRIELYSGDLAALPKEHAVDILVVSAFLNDYVPTPNSLIGALARKGIFVSRLATSKQVDMRQEFSCWISNPILGNANFNRILCIESGWRGQPPEVTDDIFRALAPSSLTEFPEGSIAMPLIGCGDQGYPADEVMRAILRSTIFWLRHGLSLRIIKIVVRSENTAILARKAFLETKQADGIVLENQKPESIEKLVQAPTDPIESYDVFLSYSHLDSVAAQSIVDYVTRRSPGSRIFFDRNSLTPGGSWLMRLAECLDTARFVATLYTPHYWSSKYCKDQFTAAHMRQNDTGKEILFPIFYQQTNIPYLFRAIQYEDCREANMDSLGKACDLLCKKLEIR